jgi:hypothetical protein
MYTWVDEQNRRVTELIRQRDADRKDLTRKVKDNIIAGLEQQLANMEKQMVRQELVINTCNPV